jgi:pterin-4a-carbinolamine dehydratase
VRLVLWTHDRGGITRLDLEYADAFDRLLDERFSAVLAVS